MDANGTRAKILLGRDDWARCEEGGVELPVTWRATDRATGTDWDPDGHELTLATSPWRFPPAPDAGLLPIDARRGAAMDRYGNWFWIDETETGLLVTSSGDGRTTRFWPAGVADPTRVHGSRPPEHAGFGPVRAATDGCPARLRGLCVTDDHHLLVGTMEPGGLLAFDLATTGAPLRVEWPTGVRFEPWAMAARPGGGAYVLEGPAGDRRGWRLDRRLMVEPLGSEPPAAVAAVAQTFGPMSDQGLQPSPAVPPVTSAIVASDAVPLAGDPIDIGVVNERLVVVLDRRDGVQPSVVRRFDADLRESPGSPHALDGLPRTLVAHAMAVIPTHAEIAGDGDTAEATVPVADLYLVDTLGDQAYRFPLPASPTSLRVRSEYLPMRLFGARGLVATPSGAWYDCVDRWMSLVAQPRPQYATSAVIETPVLDSAIPGCTWHRAFLEGCIPSEAGLRIASAASDDLRSLEAAPDYSDEPVPYRRGDGTDRPYPATPPDARYGTYEVLLQAARGRYLRLRIELAGNRRTSPRLRSLRVTYPRFSYLEQYLPHAYREEPGPAHFLDGFLANLEGTFTAIEDRIAAAQVLFDARSAPREALDWLASWFDLVMDPGWDEDRRRLLLRHAVELFRMRGTTRGLRTALGLATLVCPDDRLFATTDGEPGGVRIVERYQTKRVPPIRSGDPSGAALPREAGPAGRWTPGHGATALHARYASYLRRIAAAGLAPHPTPADLRYPVRAPGPAWDRAWQAFSEEALGIVPSAGPADAGRWRAFLERRYLTPGAANDAHRRVGAPTASSFEALDLPSTLPVDGAPLADWYAFESIVMGGVRAAHRFSVLLPVPTGGSARRTIRTADARERRAHQERVARLVELEKPAHTVFDIRSYWLAFRVGEARLGTDSRIDLGSRSPDLYPPAVLGSMHLGEGVLTSSMADVPARPAVFSGAVDAVTRRYARRTDG